MQTKDVKSPKSPKDLPVVEGMRSIKSMWEKGNVQNPAAPGPAGTITVTVNKVPDTVRSRYCPYQARLSVKITSNTSCLHRKQLA